MDASVYAGVILPLYNAFTAYVPQIPKMYWETYSQEERIAAICRELDKIVAYANSLSIQINYNTEEIEKLWEEIEKIENGDINDKIKSLIQKWIDNNMEWIIEQAIKMVWFGLTDDGYFCAYIPASWADIEFDTGLDYTTDEYGRLILKY